MKQISGDYDVTVIVWPEDENYHRECLITDNKSAYDINTSNGYFCSINNAQYLEVVHA